MKIRIRRDAPAGVPKGSQSPQGGAFFLTLEAETLRKWLPKGYRNPLEVGRFFRQRIIMK